MPIQRPRADIETVNDTALAVTGSGGISDMIALTGGPGILKGGGFLISTITNFADQDFLIEVDGTLIFDHAMTIADNIIDEGPSSGITVVSAAPLFDVKLDDNINLGFLTSLKFQVRNNNVAAESLLVRGLMTWHKGAS